MSASQLVAQAAAVLEGALTLRRGDEVLIVWDETVTADLVEALRCAAITSGIRPYVFTYQPLAYRPMAEFGLFAGASLPPGGVRIPAGLAGALASCPVIAFATSDLDFLMFAPPFKDILAGGTRVVSLSYLTTESAMRLLPGSLEEVEALRACTDEGGSLMAKAKKVCVTSPAGTDLVLELGDYTAKIHNGVVAKGARQSLPGGQVSRVPNDGTANGTIVIDRSIAANDFKQLGEPVRFIVEDGYVTKVEGDLEAAKLGRWLARHDDREIYHLTELAFGTNPRCRLSGVAAPCEDTHTTGCVSVALGADVHIGGRVMAPAHIDMTMRDATLELDAHAVVKDGALAF
ncbi:MAG: hypothetical protein ABR525_08780 [Candidatus Limnocylindria bacterium]